MMFAEIPSKDIRHLSSLDGVSALLKVEKQDTRWEKPEHDFVTAPSSCFVIPMGQNRGAASVVMDIITGAPVTSAELKRMARPPRGSPRINSACALQTSTIEGRERNEIEAKAVINNSSPRPSQAVQQLWRRCNDHKFSRNGSTGEIQGSDQKPSANGANYFGSDVISRADLGLLSTKPLARSTSATLVELRRCVAVSQDNSSVSPRRACNELEASYTDRGPRQGCPPPSAFHSTLLQNKSMLLDHSPRGITDTAGRGASRGRNVVGTQQDGGSLARNRTSTHNSDNYRAHPARDVIIGIGAASGSKRPESLSSSSRNRSSSQRSKPSRERNHLMSDIEKNRAAANDDGLEIDKGARCRSQDSSQCDQNMANAGAATSTHVHEEVHLKPSLFTVAARPPPKCSDYARLRDQSRRSLSPRWATPHCDSTEVFLNTPRYWNLGTCAHKRSSWARNHPTREFLLPSSKLPDGSSEKRWQLQLRS